MKKSRLKKTPSYFKSLLFVMCLLLGINNSYSQQYEHLEKRIRGLEEKVRYLESQLGVLSQKTQSNPPVSTNTSPSTSYTSTQQSETQTVPTKTASSEIPLTNIIRARLFKKKVERNAMQLLIAFTNATRQNITAFKGTVLLKDYMGVELMSFLIEFTKPISSLESESWFGEIPYDPYNESHKNVISIRDEEIKIDLELTEVVYSDGTVKRAGE